MLKIDPNNKETEKMVNEFLITLNEINKYMDEREQYIASLEEKLARKSPVKFLFKKVLLKTLKFFYRVSEKLHITRFFKTFFSKFPKLSSYIKRKLKS